MPVVRILPKIDNHISFFTYLCDYFWKIIYQTDILRCVTATWGGVAYLRRRGWWFWRYWCCWSRPYWSGARSTGRGCYSWACPPLVDPQHTSGGCRQDQSPQLQHMHNSHKYVQKENLFVYFEIPVQKKNLSCISSLIVS